VFLPKPETALRNIYIFSNSPTSQTRSIVLYKHILSYIPHNHASTSSRYPFRFGHCRSLCRFAPFCHAHSNSNTNTNRSGRAERRGIHRGRLEACGGSTLAEKGQCSPGRERADECYDYEDPWSNESVHVVYLSHYLFPSDGFLQAWASVAVKARIQ
jgi:hypothetical protein